MKKSNRINGEGATAPARTQEKRPNASRRQTRKFPRGKETVISWRKGLTLHTIHRSGSRFSLIREIIDGKPVRLRRAERRAITYREALLMVRDNVLFPAINRSIPQCMAADMNANVITAMAGFPGTLHIVGTSEIPIPPDREIDLNGVMRRKAVAK